MDMEVREQDVNRKENKFKELSQLENEISKKKQNLIDLQNTFIETSENKVKELQSEEQRLRNLQTKLQEQAGNVQTDYESIERKKQSMKILDSKLNEKRANLEEFEEYLKDRE